MQDEVSDRRIELFLDCTVNYQDVFCKFKGSCLLPLFILQELHIGQLLCATRAESKTKSVSLL